MGSGWSGCGSQGAVAVSEALRSLPPHEGVTLDPSHSDSCDSGIAEGEGRSKRGASPGRGGVAGSDMCTQTPSQQNGSVSSASGSGTSPRKRRGDRSIPSLSRVAIRETEEGEEAHTPDHANFRPKSAHFRRRNNARGASHVNMGQRSGSPSSSSGDLSSEEFDSDVLSIPDETRCTSTRSLTAEPDPRDQSADWWQGPQSSREPLQDGAGSGGGADGSWTQTWIAKKASERSISSIVLAGLDMPSPTPLANLAWLPLTNPTSNLCDTPSVKGLEELEAGLWSRLQAAGNEEKEYMQVVGENRTDCLALLAQYRLALGLQTHLPSLVSQQEMLDAEVRFARKLHCRHGSLTRGKLSLLLAEHVHAMELDCCHTPVPGVQRPDPLSTSPPPLYALSLASPRQALSAIPPVVETPVGPSRHLQRTPSPSASESETVTPVRNTVLAPLRINVSPAILTSPVIPTSPSNILPTPVITPSPSPALPSSSPVPASSAMPAVAAYPTSSNVSISTPPSLSTAVSASPVMTPSPIHPIPSPLSTASSLPTSPFPATVSSLNKSPLPPATPPFRTDPLHPTSSLHPTSPSVSISPVPALSREGSNADTIGSKSRASNGLPGVGRKGSDIPLSPLQPLPGDVNIFRLPLEESMRTAELPPTGPVKAKAGKAGGRRGRKEKSGRKKARRNSKVEAMELLLAAQLTDDWEDESVVEQLEQELLELFSDRWERLEAAELHALLAGFRRERARLSSADHSSSIALRPQLEQLDQRSQVASKVETEFVVELLAKRDRGLLTSEQARELLKAHVHSVLLANDVTSSSTSRAASLGVKGRSSQQRESMNREQGSTVGGKGHLTSRPQSDRSVASTALISTRLDENDGRNGRRSRPDSGVVVSSCSASYSSSEAARERDDTELSTDSQWMTASLDSLERVLQVRAGDHDSMKSLVGALTRGCGTAKLKAHALYRWLACQSLPYFAAMMSARSSSPAARLKQLADGKTSYANVYRDMAKAAGLKCETVEGFVKGREYRAGGSVRSAACRHVWNAVMVEDQWRLLDVAMGATPLKYFVEHFFMTTPDEFRLSHFPRESRWQLVSPPLSIDEFQGTLKTWPAMFAFNIRPLTMATDVRTYDGRLSVTVLLHGVAVTPQLEYAGPGPSLDPDTLVDTVDQEIRAAENAEAFHVTLPQEGTYYFTLLVHDLEEDEDIPVFQHRILYKDELL